MMIPETCWTHAVVVHVGLYGVAIAVADLGPPWPLYFIGGVRWWPNHRFARGFFDWRDYRDHPASYRDGQLSEAA